MWTERRRTCSTIYTHLYNDYQVIWDRQKGIVTYKGEVYPTVVEAKAQAEKDVENGTKS